VRQLAKPAGAVALLSEATVVTDEMLGLPASAAAGGLASGVALPMTQASGPRRRVPTPSRALRGRSSPRPCARRGGNAGYRLACQERQPFEPGRRLAPFVGRQTDLVHLADLLRLAS
jgi:hypothetical protein